MSEEQQVKTPGADLKKKQGYTLIEVTLFLALSAMISLIAFVGLGPRLRNVRFTSGMRTISDTITKQSSNLLVGINTGSEAYRCVVQGTGADAKPVIQPTAATPEGSTGSSEGCVINGRVFYFEPGRMNTYYITSLRQPKEGCINPSMADVDRLLCYAPYAYNNVFNTKQPPEAIQTTYPNGITFTASADSDNTKLSGSQAFGYMVDPDSNVRYQFIYGIRTGGFGDSPRNPGDFGGINNPLKASDLDLNETKTYCFALGSRFAGLQVTPDSVVPRLNFEDEQC